MSRSLCSALLALLVLFGVGCPEQLPEEEQDAGVDVGADAGSSDAATVDAALPDGGPRDAALADTGPPDSGLVDAGPMLVDAGLDDGGLADAGFADGGLADAGFDAGLMLSDGGVDAGLMLADGGVDAGGLDAGMRDAGMPDAGTPDGGIPDGGTPLSCAGWELEGSVARHQATGLRWQRFVGACGAGFRVPSAEELEGIVEFDPNGACLLNGCVFIGDRCGVFRSTSTEGTAPVFVDFQNGQRVLHAFRGGRLRCVKDAPAPVVMPSAAL